MAEEEVVIEIPPVLESVLRYCLKDASERMGKGEVVLPFSALAVGETLFMEEHDADSVEESFASVRRTVSGARGAQAYGFCYDGFLELQLGNRDALIAEGGVPGEEYGHAIALPYTIQEDGAIEFRDEPIYVSKSLNYMSMIDPTEDVEDEPEGDAADAVEEAAEGTAEETSGAASEEVATD